MPKPATWKCGACGYERVKTTGALPETAACPRCGVDMEALAAELKAKAEVEPEADHAGN
jgi:rubredoxin